MGQGNMGTSKRGDIDTSMQGDIPGWFPKLLRGWPAPDSQYPGQPRKRTTAKVILPSLYKNI